MAKTICRMQRNVGNFVRDFWRSSMAMDAPVHKNMLKPYKLRHLGFLKQPVEEKTVICHLCGFGIDQQTKVCRGSHQMVQAQLWKPTWSRTSGY